MADDVDSEHRARPGAATSTADTLSHVFLSYASQNVTVAERLCAALEHAGLHCWIAPRNVRPGESYAAAIVQAINSCRTLVLVLSQSAIESSHVLRELERASSKNRPVLAIRMDSSALPPEFEYFLSANQWLDAPGGAIEPIMPALIAALQGRARIAHGQATTTHSTALPSAPQTAPPARRPRGMGSYRIAIALAAVIVLGLVYLGAQKFWPHKPSGPMTDAGPAPGATANSAASSGASSAATSDAAANASSIAVLPFANLSGDASQDYFCDGLSEEILNALVRLPELKVIGRTSSFSFKGKHEDLRSIGHALGVANLLDGSVRRQGDRVRISAQLIRAADGVELWSQSFDRNLSDVLKVQAEIAAAIAARIASGADRTRGIQEAAPTTNAPAYDRYLEAEALENKGDDNSVEAGIKKLEEAVALDPTLAPAWAALASDYGYQYLYNKSVTFAQAAARVAAARRRALELDPKSVRALLAIPGNNEKVNDWTDHDAALRSVLSANPNDLAAIRAFGNFLLATGRARESTPYLKRASELDPLSPYPLATYGFALYIDGKETADGKALIDRSLALNSMGFYPRFLRMEILLGEGDLPAAVEDQRFLLKYAAFDDTERAFGEQMMALSGDRKALRDHIARGLELERSGKLRTDWMDLDRWALAAGDAQLAADAMREEDARPESRFSFIWRWAPLFAPARALPVFKELVRKHRLPEYWRSHGWPDVCGPIGADDFQCH